MRGINTLLLIVVCGITLGTAPLAGQGVPRETPRAETGRHWHHGKWQERRMARSEGRFEGREFRHHRFRYERGWAGHYHRHFHRHLHRHHRPSHGSRQRGEI